MLTAPYLLIIKELLWTLTLSLDSNHLDHFQMLLVSIVGKDDKRVHNDATNHQVAFALNSF